MKTLKQKYPPSEPCSCETCRSYCLRPGWWTVEEAEAAIRAGYAHRMMLELSPDGDLAVLSPAFLGNEVNFALQDFAGNGCSFFREGHCELFGTGHEPLECRFCHHDRTRRGMECHQDLAKDWMTPHAKRVIVRWGNLTGFWEKQGLRMEENGVRDACRRYDNHPGAGH